MKNKAYNLAGYSFQKDEPFLLDANVWLYLHPAPSDGIKLAGLAYSKALKGMLISGSRVILDALVLSEYINRYCRIEWEALHKVTYPKFKEFRKSSDFVSVGQGAAIFANAILGLCSRHDHPFTRANIPQILSDFESGINDFNDGLLAETCRHNGWKLVTHDGDFMNGGIEVLTTNRALLNACLCN